MLSARRTARYVAAAGALASSSAATAAAHIDLLEPEARAHGTAARGDTDIDVNSNLKSSPCGQISSGRTERVASYAPGQTITVRVREENAHVSYLRVSIDLDGEEFPLRTQAPPAPETQAEAEAAEAALGASGLLAVVRENNDTAGFVHEIQVTLPDASCSSCTLQVLQFMYDDPAAPYYFQCADLVLAGGAPDAGAEPAAPEDEAGGSGSGTLGPGSALEPEAVAPAGASNGASTPAASPRAGGPTAAGANPGGAVQVASAPVGSVAAAEGRSGSSGCALSHGVSGATSLASLWVFALGCAVRRRWAVLRRLPR